MCVTTTCLTAWLAMYPRNLSQHDGQWGGAWLDEARAWPTHDSDMQGFKLWHIMKGEQTIPTRWREGKRYQRGQTRGQTNIACESNSVHNSNPQGLGRASNWEKAKKEYIALFIARLIFPRLQTKLHGEVDTVTDHLSGRLSMRRTPKNRWSCCKPLYVSTFGMSSILVRDARWR